MSQTNDNILADSIAGIPHLAAFDAMANASLNAVEVENLLVYVIDTVSESALPALAKQFDIEGFRGYGLAATDEQRRAIIKQAIDLKRHMGTVWAIRKAMELVGYTDAVLVEGVDTGDPDTDWARFQIETVLGDTIGVDGITQSDLANLVREYKPTRSVFEGASFVIGIEDTLPPIADDLYLEYTAPELDEDLGHISRFHNGQYNRDGSINHIESNDSLVITISNA